MWELLTDLRPLIDTRGHGALAEPVSGLAQSETCRCARTAATSPAASTTTTARPRVVLCPRPRTRSTLALPRELCEATNEPRSMARSSRVHSSARESRTNPTKPRTPSVTCSMTPSRSSTRRKRTCSATSARTARPSRRKWWQRKPRNRPDDGDDFRLSNRVDTVPRMATVRIGILGAARIAPAAVIKPAAQRRARPRSSRSRRAIAAAPRRSRRSTASRRVHDSYAALDRRPRDRRDLQPAAQRAARGVDDRRARGGQARAVREAVHRERQGGRRRRRGRGAHRPRGDGGVPLPLPPARPAHARDRRERRARHDPAGRDRAVLPAARSSPTSATSTTSPAARRWTSAPTPCTWRACSAARSPRSCSAEAKLRTPDVDRAMRAELSFPSGHTGRITCSMWSTLGHPDLRPGRPATAARCT